MPVVGADEVLRKPDQVFRSAAELREIEDDWRDLAGRLPGLSYFATPDWVLSWWETIGSEVDGHVAVWRSATGRVEAVVPFGKTHHRLHQGLPLRLAVWTNIGSGPGAADHCGFAVTPELVPSAREWLGSLIGRHPALLANLDPDHGMNLVPGRSKTVATSACPRIDLPEPFTPDSVGSSKLRKQLRAYRRKLDAQNVTFRWVAPEAMTDTELRTVIDLHGQRSQQAGWTSSFTPDRIALHEALIKRAGAGRGPATVIAELDGEPVGILYGFRWNDVFAYYQSGWLADFAAANLATVLVAEAVEFAAADGARVFDFLRGAEPYKYRFGATDRVDRTLLLGKGIRASVLATKFRVRRRRTE